MSPRYNAKAKRYPFKQEEVGFVKFNITAGEHFSASICTLVACSRCFHFFDVANYRGGWDAV